MYTGRRSEASVKPPANVYSSEPGRSNLYPCNSYSSKSDWNNLHRRGIPKYTCQYYYLRPQMILVKAKTNAGFRTFYLTPRPSLLDDARRASYPHTSMVDTRSLRLQEELEYIRCPRAHRPLTYSAAAECPVGRLTLLTTMPITLT